MALVIPPDDPRASRVKSGDASMVERTSEGAICSEVVCTRLMLLTAGAAAKALLRRAGDMNACESEKAACDSELHANGVHASIGARIRCTDSASTLHRKKQVGKTHRRRADRHDGGAADEPRNGRERCRHL